MKNLKVYLPLIAITAFFPLIGCSTDSMKNATPALFNTRAEAKKAAKDFNCRGAHKMGDKWMPCKSHKVYEGHKKHAGNGTHHNH